MTTLVTNAEANLEANAAAARISGISLHVTTPGLTGAAEATGGAPAYARKVPTFNAAGLVGPLGAALQPATVGVAWSNTMTFDVAAGDYTYWGAWDLLSLGVFLRGNILATSQHPIAQSQINLSIGIGPYSGA